MRVLWFTNNSAVGANQLNTNVVGCTWIVSLEAELTKVPDLQLGIAFTCKESDVSQFSVGNTIYYPITLDRHKNKFQEVYARFTHQIESDSILPKYLETIEKFNADVIHIFGSENNFGRIIPRTKVPCIIHMQGNLIVNSLKWFSGLSLIDIIRYSKKWPLLKGHGLYHDYFINKKAARREKEILKSCKYFMGRTDWDRRLSVVLSPQSRYFPCNEVMRSGFYLQEWHEAENRNQYIITSTIRNNIYKGLDTIFACKKILKQYFPELNTAWRIAGINEKDEISFLTERKYSAHLSDYNIQLLGSLNEEGLISEMMNANLFVHASHIDNSPNSVCEAMLLGMPVIASFAGGTPSIINDKVEGLLVQDGDPYALAGAVVELYRDRNLAKKLGMQARQKAMVRHNPELILNDLRTIYSSVISVN